ncbi:EAL domain-containing protein [Shewanella surugensis]|uniref:EAL domain-containing protein n=1 Tax=Shewanella surugensis TaxID=212020 RepID=A0ABT0LI94_9GAMM|nr:EAL domain-containing protein [Shewanella surugensis]MCL1127417.1 EAL domain-containing protein [Shewanella surugensis]
MMLLIEDYRLANESMLTSEVSIDVENLLFELQKERGISAGFMSNQGHMFREKLIHQKKATDAALVVLIQNKALKRMELTESKKSHSALRHKLSKIFDLSENLERIRLQVTLLNDNDFFAIYAEIDHFLIDLISQMHFSSNNIEQIKRQADLLNMLYIQDLADEQRAIMMQLLSAQVLSSSVFLSIKELENTLHERIVHTLSYASPNNQWRLNAMLLSPEHAELERILMSITAQLRLAERSQRISALMGFGGLIHDFKNYLLRNEEGDLVKFNVHFMELSQILEVIKNDPELSDVQHDLVIKLEETILAYQSNMLKLLVLKKQGLNIEDIDDRIRVYDEPMLIALKHLQKPSPNVSTLNWWRASSQRINWLHQMNGDMTQDIAEKSRYERQQALTYLIFSLLTIIVIVSVLILLGKSITEHIVGTIRRIADDMYKMANDPNLEIEVDVKGVDEIARMASALNQMLLERRKVKRELSRASAVFEHSSEGIIVTDAQNRIELINPAFTKITGYTLDDVKGKDPSILSSNHQPEDFYRDVWIKLKEEGHWRGEIWNKRKDGHIFPEYLVITLVKNETGEVTQHIGLFIDISNRKKYEQEIWYQTHFDTLTGLPNKQLLSGHLQNQISYAKTYSQSVAIAFINLDRFKFINDLHGTEVGDEILKQVASRFGTILNKEDFIARVGSDEFVMIMPNLYHGASIEKRAREINHLFVDKITINHNVISVSSSFGLSLYPDHGKDPECLIRHAETAMYQAKSDGRAHYKLFSEGMDQTIFEQIKLEQRLRKAVLHSDFYINYQPIIDMSTGSITSVEALLRWRDPELGVISPDKFIPIAEETGLIDALGKWVLEQALCDLARWHKHGHKISLAINVSGRQCINHQGESFSQILSKALIQYGIAPRYLHIEITETMLIDDEVQCLQTLEEVSSLGVDIYLDDFGTGYSSLAYLKGFPISVLKIDKSFIESALESNKDANLVKAIIIMGQSLQLKLVSEGVETQQQWDFLQKLGCDYAQGYFMSRPLSGKGLLSYLESKKEVMELIE